MAYTSDVFHPVLYKLFFDRLAEGDVSPESFNILVGILYGILALWILHWICSQVTHFGTNWLQPRMMADLEQTSYEYLQRHSYRFFANNFAGSLVRKVHRLSRAFEKLHDSITFKIIPLSILAIGNLTVLYIRDPRIAYILFTWMAVFVVLNTVFAVWKQKYDVQKAKVDSEVTGTLSDGITNNINVMLFTGHTHENALYKNVTERLRRWQTFLWSVNGVVDATQAGMMVFIEFFIFLFAARLWQEGVLTIGDFALIQGYLLGLFMKLWDFNRVLRDVYEAFADAREMVEILETPHEVQDRPGAKLLDVKKGQIEFSGVVFGFEKRPVLKDFHMKIRPGEKIALVGPSGAGKSTITKLLFRFYDVKKGKILIDGQDISRVTQDSLREHISLVPQEPILFHRTLMENIRYGRRDATDEEVMEAARQAHCDDFIKDLSKGYETFVGERGIKLSGGERQRVAIARAILKNAPILVLDEATSSLDSESESLIQDALRELMKGKTTIVIAHRLSTIMLMDRIIVIDGGQVVDQGTHIQLLKKKTGIYKKLWDIQAGGFIPEL